MIITLFIWNVLKCVYFMSSLNFLIECGIAQWYKHASVALSSLSSIPVTEPLFLQF